MSLSPEMLLVSCAVLAAAFILLRAKGAGKMAGNTVKEKIAAGAAVIDVRSPDEFADGAYPKAVNMPLQTISMREKELGPKDKPIVLYCASGARSSQAARILKSMGFLDVTNAGGLDDMPE